MSLASQLKAVQESSSGNLTQAGVVFETSKMKKMPLSENMEDNQWGIFLINVGESAQISVDDVTPGQVVLGSTRKEAKQAKEEWTRQ